MPESWLSPPTDSAPQPFTIAVPQEAIDDLHERLRRTRWVDDFNNDDWGYGANVAYMQELVDYWLHRYDWRAQEKAMNAFSHFRVLVDGVPVHFIREPGKGPKPMPLVLTHGWPWTFWDLRKVIRPLADPAAYGGDPKDAFDVIVPSSPGYGFSTPLRRPMTTKDIAALWDRLMHDVLRYPTYAAGGGDFGAFVSAFLAHSHVPHVIGVHLSFQVLLSGGFGDVRAEDYGPGEEGWLEKMNAGLPLKTSHVNVHIHEPQTVAIGLNDSPAGIAAWLVDRRRVLSDSKGQIEARHTKDDLCTLASLYWFTGTIATSLRQYADTLRTHPPADLMIHPDLDHDRLPSLEAPTAMAIFPEDILFLPRKLCERHVNLKHWRVMPRGGHFAAFEEPELLIDDLRAFFRTLRP